jgi:hypothetical protein
MGERVLSGALFQSAHQRAKADKSFRNLAVEYFLQTLYRFVIHCCQAVADVQRDLVGWRRFRVVDRYQGRMPLAILFREYRPFRKAGILGQAMLRLSVRKARQTRAFRRAIRQSSRRSPLPCVILPRRLRSSSQGPHPAPEYPEANEESQSVPRKRPVWLPVAWPFWEVRPPA